MYAFGTSRETAGVPGPTVVAQSRQSLSVRWQNRIDDVKHLLPVDYTLGVPSPPNGGVPICKLQCSQKVTSLSV